MFDFVCARCGYQEIYHVEDMEYYLQTEYWPDVEYQEPVSRQEVARIKEGRDRKLGYRYSLSECTGFQYRVKDKKEVINHFTEAPEYFLDCLSNYEWLREVMDMREEVGGREGSL